VCTKCIVLELLHSTGTTGTHVSAVLLLTLLLACTRVHSHLFTITLCLRVNIYSTLVRKAVVCSDCYIVNIEVRTCSAVSQQFATSQATIARSYDSTSLTSPRTRACSTSHKQHAQFSMTATYRKLLDYYSACCFRNI
jgi:hypothetical protein